VNRNPLLDQIPALPFEQPGEVEDLDRLVHVLEADAAHANLIAQHSSQHRRLLEFEDFGEVRCERAACECGWKGPWYKRGSVS
jgi:hypothetical protein